MFCHVRHESLKLCNEAGFNSLREEIGHESGHVKWSKWTIAEEMLGGDHDVLGQKGGGVVQDEFDRGEE